MKIKLIHKSGYHSKIENQNGNSIEIDNKSDLSPKGVSPMELLLMGVAGCSSCLLYTSPSPRDRG